MCLGFFEWHGADIARGGAQAQETHIVLVEKCQVSDDTNPDEQCGGAQEDAADVIAG